ncbi:hypothetical protein xavtCFBP7764_19385 [Xanthomonas citri]|nr:hypothetical protein xavtCFBP7764_19385 [Xanthomonas citri]
MECTQSRTLAVQARHPGRTGSAVWFASACALALPGCSRPWWNAQTPPWRALASQTRKHARADCVHICGWFAATGAAPMACSHMPARLNRAAAIASIGENRAARGTTCAGTWPPTPSSRACRQLDVSANATYFLITSSRTMCPKRFVARCRLA